MFELSSALKYLKPRWRQLSSVLISFISIFVIALVVWLNVVFFSVVKGMEEKWIHKLVALTAPIRITPKDAYYQSYYYLIDSLSSSSNFREKTFDEKLASDVADPYDPDMDPEPPALWHQDRTENGELRDLVKLLFSAVHAEDGTLLAETFDVAAGEIYFPLGTDRSFSQNIFIGTYSEKNPYLTSMIDTSATYDGNRGFPVYLPKSFQKSGVLLGQTGEIVYRAMGTSGLSNQTLPIFAAGFYDPGIMSLGGRFVLGGKDLVKTMQTFSSKETSGINIYLHDLKKADAVKNNLQKRFEALGIDQYFHIATYEDFDFSKDLIAQLKSEQNLFFLLSLIILLVASSNILSLLIILVHDKKQEIGILRAMGASSFSIAAIFGLVGVALGSLGSLLGLAMSTVTLHYLDDIIYFIGMVQGRDLFNPIFYGDVIPHSLSYEVAFTTLGLTALFSLIAGIIPALKASLVQPAEILRS